MAKYHRTAIRLETEDYERFKELKKELEKYGIRVTLTEVLRPALLQYMEVMEILLNNLKKGQGTESIILELQEKLFNELAETSKEVRQQLPKEQKKKQA